MIQEHAIISKLFETILIKFYFYTENLVWKTSGEATSLDMWYRRKNNIKI